MTGPRFEVSLESRRIRGSCEVDRFWIVRDWLGNRGTIALKINATYPAAQVTANQWARTMNDTNTQGRKL